MPTQPRKSPPKKKEPPPGDASGAPSDGFPRWWKAYFAEIARNGGFKTRAAKACKIDRKAPQRWVDDNPGFAELFQATMADALDQAAETLMAEVVRRGAKGVLEPVFYQGVQIAKVRKYSDTLLMFRLNATGYGTRQTAVTFDAGRLFTDDVLQALSPDHLRRLAMGEDPLLIMAELVSAKLPPPS